MSTFVMIIDDSPTVRKILEVCLLRAGYSFKSFADGVEALRWLNTAEAPIPDLVFVDLGLPRLDGYDVIRYLKAKPAFAQTVFVIISQRDGILDRLKGRLAGASLYLTKPFKTQEIVAVIQAHLGSPVAGNTDETTAEATPVLGTCDTYVLAQHYRSLQTGGWR